jgi:hypothetical protein
MTKLFTYTNVARRTRCYVGTIQNTPESMKSFRIWRAAIKTVGRKVMLHGRHHNRKALAIKLGASHERIRQDVPSAHAERFDVYWRS